MVKIIIPHVHIVTILLNNTYIRIGGYVYDLNAQIYGIEQTGKEIR